MALALVRERAEANFHPLSELCELLNQVKQRIFAHKDAFGVQNAKFQLGCEEFVLLSNIIAMQALQQRTSHSSSQSSWAVRDCKLCDDLLQRAEQHTRRIGYLRSVQSPEGEDDEENHVPRRLEFRLVCLNNLACYFKEITKPLAALGFLEKALKIQRKQAASRRAQYGDGDDDSEEEEDPSHSIALTHLNLCAVLSQLQRHNAAAEHARSSIALLSATEESRQSDDEDGDRKTAQLALIAHFNLGVELEHLSDVEQALRVYQTALQIAKAHGITRNESELVRTIEEIVREQLAHDYRRKAAKYRSALSSRGHMSHRPLLPRSLRQTTTAHALS